MCALQKHGVLCDTKSDFEVMYQVYHNLELKQKIQYLYIKLRTAKNGPYEKILQLNYNHKLKHKLNILKTVDC